MLTIRLRVAHPLRPCLPKLIRHIRAYGLYVDKIETVYLNLTHAYYAKESNDLAAGNRLSAAEFLDHVKRRSAEERARAKEILSGNSVGLVHETADNALLADRLQWLADEGELFIAFAFWVSFENTVLYSSEHAYQGKK